ncbi:MAG: SPOR domain-containing protein [Pseudolabrys sp.]
MSSGTPAPHSNDPLAELARLIGQNDPFAEYGRQQAARQQPAPAMEPPPVAAPHYPAPMESYGAPPRYDAPQAPASPAYGQPAGQAAYPDEQSYSYAEAHGYPPGLIPPEVDRHLPNLLGSDQQQYYTVDPEAEAQADREVASRRRKVMVGAAALVLVILGISGAVAYRVTLATYGSAPPPVIKADTAPSKVMAAQRDGNNGKPIQDRLGNNPAGERMVSREEQPVDIKAAPRVVLPAPGTGQPAGAQPDGQVARGGAEPKKIRTVSIRPDNAVDQQPQAAAAAPVPAAAIPTRVASVANVPAVSAPAPVAAQPRPAAPPSVPAMPQQSRGPLSLSPDAAPSAQAPVPTRTASVPPPRAAAPVAGSGAFVQVSSQRSEADAQAAFRSLQSKYPSVLGSRALTVHRADLGAKGTYYRAMVGPLASADAVELCTSLKAAGGSCIIQKN